MPAVEPGHPAAQGLGQDPERQVVITGLGATTPLGGDVASTWRALRSGACAVRAITEDWAEDMGLPVRIAAPLAVEPSGVLGPRELRRLDRASQLALIAAREAWAQAGSPEIDQERLAVSISPGMGPVLSVMGAWDALRERGARRVAPTAVPALMPNAPAVAVGIELGARAGIHSPVAACASGAEAIAHGADLIALGRADMVLAGGTDAALHPMTIAAFAAMRALSTRNDDPAGASRPLAADRDGFVLGEGAGVVVLESAAHARARGARPLAHLAGSAITADAMDIARPDPTGAQQERALRQALAQAGLAPAELGHINAHATSTPAGDLVEARMITRVAPGAALSATKSATGHLLGGAGGLEAVLAAMAIVDGFLPPTLLPGRIDPEIADLGLDVVGPDGREAPGLGSAASTSFGFGGHNAALVLRRL
ncbi:beta-ketoacyl-[acyl-carrier-protein] synthase family protein [Actinomyces marmotae]|uniref:Beta-ketoacyl-[acyl-carrier-protein] synthase family protein n=1 Tax=Actinomyces marmotae TaxID=2737173 RepID=A0A6M8AZ62_9ACTO|nr:beta-ketoacyl-[acyl-carrier-protein] synthase family protein [Actinomyces marmotae]